MIKTHIFKTALFATVLCALCANFAYAKKRKDDKPRGTTAVELAQLKARPLPQPSKIKIAVLPVMDSSGLSENTRIATATVWQLLHRQGFSLTPILSGFAALEKDSEIEPGASLRKEDAVRLGKKLGVNWVVYGEAGELRVSSKSGWISNKKYADASLRLVVVDIANNQKDDSGILYWQMRHERAGGRKGLFGGGAHGDLNLKRDASIRTATAIFDPFFAAFPQHTISQEKFNEGTLKDFINTVWPDKDDGKDGKDNKKK